MRLHRHLMPRRGVIGSSPSVLRADPNAHPPSISVVSYGPGILDKTPITDPSHIKEWMGKNPVLWVNVEGLADVDLLREIGNLFGLHRLALEDVVNVPQRPKVETYADHLFIVVAMPDPAQPGVLEQVSVFLGKDYVLTFQERPGDCFTPVRERLKAPGPKIRESGADYLAYALLDAIVDAYFPLAAKYDEHLEAVENRILDTNDTAVINRLHVLKAELYGLRRSVWGMRDSFTTLIREESPLVSDSTRIYFRDCQDHCIQLLDLVEGYRDATAGLRDLHLSTLSNRMNEIMKVLTIIATLFIPLTFIAGIYGMNFNSDTSPWNMPELNWYWGYPVAMGSMGVVLVALLVFFRRKGWLGSQRSQSDRD